MKVKLHGRAAGPNGVFKQGDIIDLPKAAAEQLIADGGAEAAGMTERVTKPPTKGVAT